MGFFDDIVPPDIASPGGYSPLRITVRPKGVEPPPGFGNASQSPADASNETDNVAPARTGLFDDIVPPADAAAPPAETPASYGPAPRVAREGPSPPASEPNLLSRLASPLTDIPHEIYQTGAESLDAANTYLNPWSEDYRKGVEADRDKWVSTGPGSFLGTGKGLLAAAGIPFSPATGILRSLIGHPLSVIVPTATPKPARHLTADSIALPLK